MLSKQLDVHVGIYIKAGSILVVPFKKYLSNEKALNSIEVEILEDIINSPDLSVTLEQSFKKMNLKPLEF